MVTSFSVEKAAGQNGVEDPTLEVKDTKKEPRTDFPRKDPLKGKNARGQDQGHNAQVFSKTKKSLCTKNCKFSAKFPAFSKKKSLCARKFRLFCNILDVEKKGTTLAHFYRLKNSAVLGRGQVIFEDLWASRSRTSKRVFEDSTSANCVGYCHSQSVSSLFFQHAQKEAHNDICKS